jgi:glycosyltransferase involved in cell wall biosynthesis
MRILYISQYFPPEMGAPAGRCYGFARRWAQMGDDVTVLTAVPNHPAGVIYPGYKNRFSREEVDGIKVARVMIFPAPNKGVFKRSLNYLSFLISSIAGGIGLPSTEVVIASSPQLLVALSGYIISRIKRSPFVFEVRDLWPESLVAVGAARGGVSIRSLGMLARFLYRKADLIVVVTRSFIDHLAGLEIPRNKIHLIPNGIDTSLFPDKVSGEQVRKQYNLSGKFVCSYIGTLGMAHNLSTIINSAKLLEEKQGIHFLLVGDGAERERLEGEVKKLALRNITFTGRVERDSVPSFLAASDISLVLLKNDPLFRTVIPSKMFEAMAAGVPIILGVAGEAKDILIEAKAGIPITPDSEEELAGAVLKLYRDGKIRRCYGENGKGFVKERYNLKVLAFRYRDLLLELLKEKR